MQDSVRPNLLINEHSPYLLQHAYNPVNWRPWTDEAFIAALQEDKPVFVSIGYATCHWCHVMAHESFEDAEVAEYLNQHYISIKVDREERPDVDAVCMDVCQAMTGSGGWPLSIMMDSGKRPFFAGTYFPKKSRQNRLGFLDLIKRINNVWVTERDRIDVSANEVVRVLDELAGSSLHDVIRKDIYEMVVQQHTSMFDNVYGGFSVNPKFPSPHHLLLLLRSARHKPDAEIINMVTLTLDAMRLGGLYDHVGFGFHRYSTDREWLVPHFEKMLYDQAMLMMAYTEAWQVTKNNLYAITVHEIANYIERELLSESGAFYCAQDADSEGVEGKYYVWSADELGADKDWLIDRMSVRPEGNYSDESTLENTSNNILHHPWPPARGAMSVAPGALSVAPATLSVADGDSYMTLEWEPIRKRLFEKRSHRVPPITDTKVLADWNGLMIMALAKAGRAFSNPHFTNLAVSAFKGVKNVCADVTSHVGKQGSGEARKEEPAYKSIVFLDDLAMMGCAALQLYQALGDAEYLDDAERWARKIIKNYSSEGGALMLAPVTREKESLRLNTRSAYDSAYPSGNSMAMLLFVELGIVRTDQFWIDEARKCIESVGQQVNNSPSNFCMTLCAWDLVVHGYHTITFTGDVTQLLSPDEYDLLQSSYLPNVLIRYENTGVIPETKPRILICDEISCGQPMYESQQLIEFIKQQTR